MCLFRTRLIIHSLKLNYLKSEGVPYNGHRTEAHGGCSDDGIKNPSRHRIPNRVVNKCKEEVLLIALAEPFGIHVPLS
jgi:hypothetical protein